MAPGAASKVARLDMSRISTTAASGCVLTSRTPPRQGAVTHASARQASELAGGTRRAPHDSSSTPDGWIEW